MPVDPLLSLSAPVRGVLGGGAGLLIGSFLATVAVRWPDVPVSRGRSRCDDPACGRRLGAAELVPLLSYVAQRGRCRGCGRRIDPRHPVVELLAALVGGLSLALVPGLDGAAGALFGWALLLLALLDLDHRWLPDRIVLPLGGLGMLSGVAGIGVPTGDRLIGAAAGFLSLAAIAAAYRRLRGRVGLGGGDPKLFGAIGAWLGWAALPIVLLGASLSGLLTALGLAASGRTVTAATRLPLGTFLAPAAWAAWLLLR